MTNQTKSVPLTLVFIVREFQSKRQVLLGHKKRGFGKGKWNGFGGKVEAGETVEEAAVREMQEESGVSIRLQDLKSCGQLFFTFNVRPELMHVHVFKADVYEGEPVETEEMRPQWFDTEDIPYDEMWADDRHWLPLVLLKNKKINGRFHFDDDSLILNQDVQIDGHVE